MCLLIIDSKYKHKPKSGTLSSPACYTVQLALFCMQFDTKKANLIFYLDLSRTFSWLAVRNLASGDLLARVIAKKLFETLPATDLKIKEALLIDVKNTAFCPSV